MESMVLAIIPARGGSKGIPRKNVRLLAGMPLIAYTIEQAKRAGYVQRVIVSTDDPEIAAISQEYGAEVVWRPAEISGDTASSEAALLYTLDYLRRTERCEPDLTVFLQCTSPLTLAEDIDGTVRVLLDQSADSALAVTPFHYFLWREGGEAGAVGINHDKRVRPLRQEREPQYLETGAVYVMKTRGFIEAGHRFFGKTATYIMPAERCHEIDEPVDFEVAEVLLRRRQQDLAQTQLPDIIEALILDFDGVFTDNRVIVHEDGREAVLCDRGDGLGIEKLRNLGIAVLVLSSEMNPVVAARCAKLGIPCQQGVRDKLAALRRWAGEQGISLAHVLFVGNDVNDVACLAAVGCGVAVADAYLEAKAAARLVLSSPGGHGAIRELANLIVEHRKGKEVRNGSNR